MEDIIEYIENPPLKEERLTINGIDFGQKADFKYEVLEDMIKKLSDKDKKELYVIVETYCIENKASFNDIENKCSDLGTLARYQEARQILIK